MGTGIPITKEDRAARRRAARAPRRRGASSGTRTFRLRTMEGRSLDNPTRGNPTARRRARSGRKDRNASGKSAPRSGGSRATGIKFARADRSKVLEGHDAATRRKVEEGSSERPGSRDFDRILPPAEAPHGAGAWRGPRPGAVRGRARMAFATGAARRAPGATPCSQRIAHAAHPNAQRREGGGGTERNRSPLKTR